MVGSTSATVSSAYAHDGNYGLGIPGDGWIYRNDLAAQVAQGDTLSVWVRFDQIADARAYFGFGATSAGALSFVLAPNSGDIRFEENAGYGFDTLNLSSQSFAADKWYRAEVIWGVGGNLTGKLYDSDGTTLLNSVSATSSLYTSGGIAFRGFDGVKAFDTVTKLNAVPEPSTLTMSGMVLALAGVVAYRRRRAA